MIRYVAYMPWVIMLPGCMIGASEGGGQVISEGRSFRLLQKYINGQFSQVNADMQRTTEPVSPLAL